MVDRDVDVLLRKAIDKLRDFTANLKVEQRNVVAFLLGGHDALTVSPMTKGFGKSLIFQVFALAAEMEREHRLSAVPYTTPSKDQISEARNKGLLSLLLDDLSMEELKAAKFQLLIWMSRKGSRGTIVKCPERQPLFDLPQFGSRYNQFSGIPTPAIFEVGFLLPL